MVVRRNWRRRLHISARTMLCDHAGHWVLPSFNRQASRPRRVARSPGGEDQSHAVVQGAEIVELIVDGGESAEDLRRPGMERLLKMVDGRVSSARCEACPRAH